MGLEAEAEALIKRRTGCASLDVRRIVGLARSPEEAAEIYAASLVLDDQSLEEKGYLLCWPRR